ncbi:MAG: YqjF family protein [Bacillus sp. (in: firmicutes)]
MEKWSDRQGTHKKHTWLMTQAWKDVLFLHWPVPEELVKGYIPEELEIDLFEGQAWISLVLFKVEETRLRFLPLLPGIHAYLELNVRTYVKYKNISGVYFFTLDANKNPIVRVPRIGNFLPYNKAAMSNRKTEGRHLFESVRECPDQFSERLEVAFAPGRQKIAEKKEIDVWLTERYSLWTKPKYNVYRLDIHHREWELYPADAEIKSNSMAGFTGGYVDADAPIVHYAPGRKPIFFPPVREKWT